jgi:hypothetical protein
VNEIPPDLDLQIDPVDEGPRKLGDTLRDDRIVATAIAVARPAKAAEKGTRGSYQAVRLNGSTAAQAKAHFWLLLQSQRLRFESVM